MAFIARARLVGLWSLLWRGAALGDIPSREIAPGVSMPVISIGTGGLEHDDEQARAIVSNWMSLGGRGVDTAQVYRDQAVVAKAIAGAGVKREEVFITTKVVCCAGVAASVESNLKQLGTDYIDLLLIHFPAPGIESAWATLEDFHARGVLKAIGVSNFNASLLEELLRTAKVVPAVNQVQHNVLRHDDATVAFARAHNITVEAYSPLGRQGHSGDIPGHPVIRRIAASHNVSAYQVAMRWILQHGHLITFQSTSRSHQQGDADIFGFNLTSEEMSTLDEIQLALAYDETMFV